MNTSLDQYVKDSGLYLPRTNRPNDSDSDDSRPGTPNAGKEFDFDIDDEEMEHHDKFRSEKEDDSMGVSAKPVRVNLDSEKLNKGLDDLVQDGEIMVPEYKNAKKQKNFRPPLNNQGCGNQYRNRNNGPMRTRGRYTQPLHNPGTSQRQHTISPWVNGFPPNQFNGHTTRQAPGPSHYNMPPHSHQHHFRPQQFQPPVSLPVKSRLYCNVSRATPYPVRTGLSNEQLLQMKAQEMLSQVEIPVRCKQNILRDNPNGLVDMLVQIAHNHFGQKYDMSIQKKVAAEQGKEIFVKDGVEMPITTEGGEGVDDLNDSMRGTNTTLNKRWA